MNGKVYTRTTEWKSKKNIFSFLKSSKLNFDLCWNHPRFANISPTYCSNWYFSKSSISLKDSKNFSPLIWRYWPYILSEWSFWNLNVRTKSQFSLMRRSSIKRVWHRNVQINAEAVREKRWNCSQFRIRSSCHSELCRASLQTHGGKLFCYPRW